MIACNGFAGQVDFDPDAEVFGGTVVNSNVLMSFEGKTVAEHRKSLRDVGDAYLADYEAAGKQHEKPYNGTIIIRVDPEIHRHLPMRDQSPPHRKREGCAGRPKGGPKDRSEAEPAAARPPRGRARQGAPDPWRRPSGGARPTAYTAPITRTADPSSGRLSQVPTGRSR